MAGGITVQIDGGEIEREIFRLTASIEFINVESTSLIEREKNLGIKIAKKNIQQYVYARPQEASSHYTRTENLLNAVRAGIIHSAGAIAGGQVYITRQMPNFKRVYYPVFVEHGHDAGAPYEGRGYWAATTAELVAGLHAKVAISAKTVARRMVQ